MNVKKEFSKLPLKKVFFSAKPNQVPENVYIESAKKQHFVMASQEPIIFKNILT